MQYSHAAEKAYASCERTATHPRAQLALPCKVICADPTGGAHAPHVKSPGRTVSGADALGSIQGLSGCSPPCTPLQFKRGLLKTGAGGAQRPHLREAISEWRAARELEILLNETNLHLWDSVPISALDRLPPEQATPVDTVSQRKDHTEDGAGWHLEDYPVSNQKGTSFRRLQPTSPDATNGLAER